MRRVFQLTALVVLALWLPTTVHCNLETLLGWATEACCGEHTDDDRATPVEHCVVEDGDYRITEVSVPVVAPDMLVSWCVAAIVMDQLRDAARPSLVRCESPPELTRTWQFSRRTALPVRAPSCVS